MRIQLHDLWKMLTFETSCLHRDIINVNPNHFVHITASARPHGAVKNCSLFELVKTNNQDQRKGDKIKPEPRAGCRASGHRQGCLVLYLFAVWDLLRISTITLANRSRHCLGVFGRRGNYGNQVKAEEKCKNQPNICCHFPWQRGKDTPMALKPGFWLWCPLSLFVTQCKDETDFVLIKLPILNNSLFASSCINYDQMQCMAKYNNKMQFLNSSARTAHCTLQRRSHTLGSRRYWGKLPNIWDTIKVLLQTNTVMQQQW